MPTAVALDFDGLICDGLSENMLVAWNSHHGKEVEEFVRRANDYRARARAAWRGTWLGYHELYPGMHELLRALGASTYIVTAKDAGSVLAILASNGIEVDPARVFGELRSKVRTLELIAEREGGDRGDVLFLDDSVANVVGARGEGYDAHWATWGYNAPEHYELARDARVPLVALDDVPELAARLS